MQQNNNADILRASIKEQQILYTHISNTFDQLRIKALALIAGEIALVSFLFIGGESSWLLDRGDVVFFFCIGVGALIVAFAMLLWTISTVVWKLAHGPVGSTDLLGKYRTEEEFLTYLNDDYATINKHNMTVVTPRLKRFNWIVYLLSAGVIIVLAIKYGGIQLWQ